MDLDQAFRILQENVNADPAQVEEARRRRKMFERAFATLAEVARSRGIGSLARGSQIEPINDVDLLIIFDPTEVPGWGEPGSSAEEALEQTRAWVKELLGSQEALQELFGDEAGSLRWVRHTRIQNHAVKCFLDDPDDEDAFTVDVVPALPRPGGGVFIPEVSTAAWIATDPEYLVESVLERHGGFGEGQFVQLIRVLKRWSADNGAILKGLTVEVLALSHLRDEPRPAALAGFFTAAAAHIFEPIVDPADLCGEIQRDLDRSAAHQLLAGASERAAAALAAAADGDTDHAICIWREILGDVFPEPEGGCEGFNSSKLAGGLAGVAVTTPGSRQRRVKDSPGG